MSVTDAEPEVHSLTTQEIEPLAHLTSVASVLNLAGSLIESFVTEVFVKTVVNELAPQVHLTELAGVVAESWKLTFVPVNYSQARYC